MQHRQRGDTNQDKKRKGKERKAITNEYTNRDMVIGEQKKVKERHSERMRKTARNKGGAERMVRTQ